MFNYSNYKDSKLFNIVSNIEKMSSHPISVAFNVRKQLDVDDFKVLTGIGIYGRVSGNDYYLGNDKILAKLNIKDNFDDYDYLVLNGCTIIYVVENKKVIGLIGVRDIVRDDMKEVILEFDNNNIDTVMLTGDNEMAAKVIASDTLIKNVVAGVLPKEKALYVKNMVDSGRNVIMVGDGINDAPALASATIGISVNDGTDVAMDCSDVILMNNDMKNILDLINISKKSYKIIKQNLFWAFFYNLCMIPIAMGLFRDFGLNMTPMFGSIAMVFSSLTVVLNSLRLGRMKI